MLTIVLNAASYQPNNSRCYERAVLHLPSKYRCGLVAVDVDDSAGRRKLSAQLLKML